MQVSGDRVKSSMRAVGNVPLSRRYGIKIKILQTSGLQSLVCNIAYGAISRSKRRMDSAMLAYCHADG
jgi:hypothetical protein